MKKNFIKLLVLVLIIQVCFNLIDIIFNPIKAANKIYVKEGETYTFTASSSTYNLSDSSIASVSTDASTYAIGNRGTSNAYNGDEVDLEKCLYTFTANGNNYRIASGSYYLYIRRTGNWFNYKYYPNYTGTMNITVTNNNGNYTFRNTSRYYLYFNTNGYITGNTSSSTFSLYKPVEGGETSSTEIPGYIKVNSITAGEKYLIVKPNGDDYYALYPSTSTSTNYDQTVKISQKSETEYTITGKALGTTILTVDGEEYEINVYDENTIIEPDSKFNDKALTIGMGTTYTISTNVSGMTWISNDTSIATVSSSGVVTPVSKGETTLTATYNGTKYSFRVRVIDGATSGMLVNISIDTDNETRPYYNPSFGTDFYELVDGEKVYGYLDNSTYQGIDFWAGPKEGYVLSYMSTSSGHTPIAEDTVTDIQNESSTYFLQTQANNFTTSDVVKAIRKAVELKITGIDGFSRGSGTTSPTKFTMVFRSDKLSPNITQEVYSINGERYSNGDKAKPGDTVIFEVKVAKTSNDEYQVNYDGVLKSNLEGAVFIGTSPTGTGKSSTQNVTLSSKNQTSKTYYIKYVIPNSVSSNITNVATYEYSTYAESTVKTATYKIEQSPISDSGTVKVEGVVEKTYITLKKEVAGNMRETDKYFKFLVTINGTNGNTYRISGQDSNITYDNAQINTDTTYTVGSNNYIYLKGGQTVTIGLASNGTDTQIPVGVTYSIVEQDAEEYATIITGIQGETKTTGNMTTQSSDNVVEFLNSRDAAALTGRVFEVANYAILFSISIFICYIIIIKHIKKIDKKHN